MRTEPKIQANSYQIREAIKDILSVKYPKIKVFNFRKTPFQVEDLPLINIVSPSQSYLRSPDGGNYTRTTKVELQIIATGSANETSDGYDDTLDQLLEEIQEKIFFIFLNDMETLNKTIFSLVLTDVEDIPDNSTEKFLIRRHIKFDAITHDGTRLKTQLPPNQQ